MAFQSSFPHSGSTPITTESGPHSIGIVLHYGTGPSKLGLLSCSDPPSVSTCTNPKITDQDNSGTLRLAIKSYENPAKPDKCDYHVHHAYRRMLKLLDPQLMNQKNKDKAFIDVPSSNACTECDPQQDTVPSECSLKSMRHAADYGDASGDVSANLDSLVKFLIDLRLEDGPKNAVLVDLPKQQGALHGKFPSRLQLRAIEESLGKSQVALNNLLSQQQLSTNKTESRETLRIAIRKERALYELAERVYLLSISGKDCRAPMLRIN